MGGGLFTGHVFEKTPPMTRSCTACHGSRVGNEFLGKNEGFPGDVHFREATHELREMPRGRGTRTAQPRIWRSRIPIATQARKPRSAWTAIPQPRRAATATRCTSRMGIRCPARSATRSPTRVAMVVMWRSVRRAESVLRD
ncbi:MAG: hypothetical protein MZV64_19905 [Ignavibacteriales bacterium]|nr:hypothetical protein [Ignavibacteriales bacterium]